MGGFSLKPNWHEIWEKRPLALNGSLKSMINANGFDSIGSMSEEIYLRRVHQVSEQVNLTNVSKAFEVGCGVGAFIRVLEREYGTQVGGADFSNQLIGQARGFLKAPLGLFVAEANEVVDLEVKVDLVISHSVFQYFPSLNYAREVLNAMSSYLTDKGGQLAILDVRDSEKRIEYLQSRNLREGEIDSLGHTLYKKEFFIDSITELGFDEILIQDCYTPDYANGEFAFDVFARRK